MKCDVKIAKQKGMNNLTACTCYTVSKTQKSLGFEVLNPSSALNFSCRRLLKSTNNISMKTLTTFAHCTPVFITPVFIVSATYHGIFRA